MSQLVVIHNRLLVFLWNTRLLILSYLLTIGYFIVSKEGITAAAADKKDKR